MNEPKSPRQTDLEKLSRLKSLSWLSRHELTLLVGVLALGNFKRRETILLETATSSTAHILLSGIVRITCLNARHERVTVSLIAPGPIPEFPALPINQHGFRCEAYSDCRVGSVNWNTFDSITVNTDESPFKMFQQFNLKQWYRLLLRSSSFLNLGLHDRIGIALLELCTDFGIEESRGTLLRVSFSHKDIANLVGASRPRVTEHIAQLERERLLTRQGRQLVVQVDRLTQSLNSHAN